MIIKQHTPASPFRINTWLLFFACGIFISCERDINFKLEEQQPKLVVEATIENDQPPIVVLTTSLNYFSKVSPEIIANSFVHNAIVTVSNGTLTHKLKEYATTVSPGLNLYYYTIDTANISTSFVGQLNKTYSLAIVADGKNYSATTTIPRITKVIDSLWWKPAVDKADSNDVILMIKATDPPGFGDYVRYFTKRNSERFLAPLNSTFDDLFVDGTTYQLPIDPGVDRNNPADEKERVFHHGDTLQLKLSNIDKVTYDFWRTMEFSYQSVGNPFSTPIKVLSNIKGNALGYFGGYASQYKRLTIPK